VQAVQVRGTSVDQGGFSDLFFAHAARLVRLARLLGDDDPEDVVQEAFCKLYAARRRVRAGDDKAVAYLNRVVVNEVRSRHRRRAVARRDAHLLRTDEEHDPMSAHDDRSAVLHELALLPHRQRESIVLRYWMDLPLATIAEVMGVRVGTVKAQISRGLAALEAALTPEEDR
jgi:RNA polymerase sigma-70 factor (sigma-E family)